MKYRKTPVVIEAIQFKRDCFEDVREFTENKAVNFRTERHPNGKSYCEIPTLGGTHTVTEGDYIIKDAKGEYHSYKPDIFDATYEIVEE